MTDRDQVLRTDLLPEEIERIEALANNSYSVRFQNSKNAWEPFDPSTIILLCAAARRGLTPFADENLKALQTLSMGLGNPCLEATGDETLSDALVKFALDRIAALSAEPVKDGQTKTPPEP